MSPFIMTVCASFVALGIAPQEDVARESVDLIELNHFYDEHGRLVFDQVIFYDWASSESRYNVRAWRLVKNPSQLTQRAWGEHPLVLQRDGRVSVRLSDCGCGDLVFLLGIRFVIRGIGRV